MTEIPNLHSAIEYESSRNPLQWSVHFELFASKELDYKTAKEFATYVEEVLPGSRVVAKSAFSVGMVLMITDTKEPSTEWMRAYADSLCDDIADKFHVQLETIPDTNFVALPVQEHVEGGSRPALTVVPDDNTPIGA